MTATPEHVETFAPLKWATPYLTSPDWIVCDRDRGTRPGEETDRFCRDTMRAYNGVECWLELHQKPAPGAKVTKAMSLIKFGAGLTGFPGACHGGALLTLMDEAQAYIMVANELINDNSDYKKLGDNQWKQKLADGKPLQEVLSGQFVTAKLDIKFLAPVRCPSVVGVEVQRLEDTGYKMNMRGIMKDANGTPLLQVDGLWVKIGGAAKL
jgi:acyl-coenzyme A thioesterase PaaI-like protein